MIASLPLFHNIAGQPVLVIGAVDVAEARRRLVERAGGTVIDNMQEAIDKGARIAFVAHADDGAMEADAIRLRCAGLLVNAADRPDLCDFTMPAIVDRSPVLIAIGTGGASAGLAKALRLRLEALLPASLGALATRLGAVRERLRQSLPDATARRRALDDALGAAGALDPFDDSSAGKVEAWAACPGATGGGETIELRIASSDPEDLTLRQARLLGSADLIAYEPSVAATVLDRCRADAARVAIGVGQMPRATSGLVIILRT